MDDDHIKSLLLQDRKIQAISLTMKQNGWGLRQAKNHAEGLQRELFPRYASMSTVPDEPHTGMIEKARQLITQGRKIEAIQLLHHTTEMTLKESKDYIDRLDAEKLMP